MTWQTRRQRMWAWSARGEWHARHTWLVNNEYYLPIVEHRAPPEVRWSRNLRWRQYINNEPLFKNYSNFPIFSANVKRL